MTEQESGADIHTNERFLRRAWRIERVAWVVMALLVLVAFLGLFGNGPLSTATASSSDGGIEVSYQRFLRVTAATRIEILVAPSVVQEGQIHLLLSHDYLEGFELQSVHPEPSSQVGGVDGVTFTFDVTDEDLTGGASIPISMSVKPTGLWRHSGELATRDASARITQFIYP